MRYDILLVAHCLQSPFHENGFALLCVVHHVIDPFAEIAIHSTLTVQAEIACCGCSTMSSSNSWSLHVQSPHASTIMRRSIQGMLEELEYNLWEHILSRLVDYGHAFSPEIEMAALQGDEALLLHGEAVNIDMALTTQVHSFYMRFLCVSQSPGLVAEVCLGQFSMLLKATPAQLSQIVQHDVPGCSLHKVVSR